MKNILLTLSVAAVLLSGCKKDDDDNNTSAPVACFSVSRDTIVALDTFSVNASCSQRASGHSWSAPNASPHTATGTTVQFYAYSSGDIDIALIVTNSEGTDTVYKNVFARLPGPLDFTGSFTCRDTCEDGASNGPYMITVAYAGTDQVLITNLIHEPVVGTVGSGTIEINHPVTGGDYYFGYGGLSLPDLQYLDISSTLTSGGIGYNCSTRCSRN